MSIRIINNRLFPFVVFDLIDFIKLNGQLIPNKTIIIASNTFATIHHTSINNINKHIIIILGNGFNTITLAIGDIHILFLIYQKMIYIIKKFFKL